MPRFRKVIASGLASLFVLLATSQHAPAETFNIGSLPRKPRIAKFRMTFAIEPVSGNGYHPVHLMFTPAGGAFLRDRHLQIEIEPRTQGRSKLDFTYRRQVTLPEGAGSHKAVFQVPHYYPWNHIRVRLIEDGEVIETGESTFHIANGLRTRFAQQVSSVGILTGKQHVPGQRWTKYPDVRTLTTVLGNGPIPENAEIPRLSHQAAKSLAAKVQPAWVQYRPIEEDSLHDHWLAYSQLDVILVAAPLLHRIELQQPQKFQHLRKWLAAGGNLWVYAAATPPADSFLGRLRLSDVDINKVLLPGNIAKELNLKEKNDTTSLTYDSWSGVQKQSGQWSWQNNNKNTLKDRKAVYQELKKRNHDFAGQAPPAKIAASVRSAEFGLGTIIAMDSEDPFPGSYQFWKSVVKFHTPGQVAWTERMGIDVARGNDNYWMWLIPSVGQPPVKSFVLLNTVFVIIVGPLCYFFLRKRQRLYLLYFVAPTLALMVTISLFAYALAADGTTTKLRSRQLTWVDAKHNVAVRQSRQTYYAVLGNRDGIELPEDAAVYPVLNTPAFNRYYQRYGRQNRKGDIWVTAGVQRFGGNFLPARTQVQYLITEPEISFPAPTFTNHDDGISVTNHSPQRWNQVIVRDENRQLWKGEQIDAGATVDLQSCQPQAVSELLDESILPLLGEVPMLQSNNRIWGGPGTGVQVSILENRLQQFSNRLPAKTFVITSELDDDRLGVDDAIVLDSVHVMMGEIP